MSDSIIPRGHPFRKVAKVEKPHLVHECSIGRVLVLKVNRMKGNAYDTAFLKVFTSIVPYGEMGDGYIDEYPGLRAAIVKAAKAATPK